MILGRIKHGVVLAMYNTRSCLSDKMRSRLFLAPESMPFASFLFSPPWSTSSLSLISRGDALLVRIVHVGSCSVNCSVARRFRLLLIDRWFVECRFVVLGVQLHQERLPFLNQLEGSVLFSSKFQGGDHEFEPTSFCASTALSKKVSTPLLKSSTFSFSNLSSSARIDRPISSNRTLAC